MLDCCCRMQICRERKAESLKTTMESLRECQAILKLENIEDSKIWDTLDLLEAHLFKLIQNS